MHGLLFVIGMSLGACADLPELTPRSVTAGAERGDVVVAELVNIMVPKVNEKRKNGWAYSKIEEELASFRARMEKDDFRLLEILAIPGLLDANGYTSASLSDLKDVVTPPTSCPQRAIPIEKRALLRKAELREALPNGSDEDKKRVKEAYVDRCLIAASFDIILRDLRRMSAMEKALGIASALSGR